MTEQADILSTQPERERVIQPNEIENFVSDIENGYEFEPERHEKAERPHFKTPDEAFEHIVAEREEAEKFKVEMEERREAREQEEALYEAGQVELSDQEIAEIKQIEQEGAYWAGVQTNVENAKKQLEGMDKSSPEATALRVDIQEAEKKIKEAGQQLAPRVQHYQQIGATKSLEAEYRKMVVIEPALKNEKTRAKVIKHLQKKGYSREQLKSIDSNTAVQAYRDMKGKTSIKKTNSAIPTLKMPSEKKLKKATYQKAKERFKATRTPDAFADMLIAKHS